MAFRRKSSRVLDLDPDVMVIQECEDERTYAECLGAEWDFFWVGENRHKGLSVIVKKSLNAFQLPIDTGRVRYLLPVRLGSALVDVMAFWAMDDKQDSRQRYIAQVWNGLQFYTEFGTRKPLIVGDFNWSASFVPSKPLSGTMQNVIGFLGDREIRSAYHVLNNAEFGEEPDSTFFMHKNSYKGYHIDYVFAPSSMLCSLQVGSLSEWADLSDHVPLIADMIGID